MANNRVYDELLCYLGDPIFQIPVRSFMDENCLIFDPSIAPSSEHEVVHKKYKVLIDTLLEGFCKDMQITNEQAVEGIGKMSAIPDLREVFHVLFEQVLASTDSKIFAQVMTKRNIMIQEQVLVMIMAATGSLPDSLQDRPFIPQYQAEKPGSKSSSAPVAAVIITGADDKQEQELLQQVMAQSKADIDKKAKVDAASKKQEEAEMKKALELSKTEAQALTEERMHLEEDMKRLALESTPSQPRGVGVGAAAAAASKPGPAPMRATQPVKAPSQRPAAAAPGVSGTDAANQWLASAQAEAGQSATHSAMAASMANMSSDELRKRQEFLRQQRDKLLAMKKEAREKQLGSEVKAQPKRPQSARAARSAMQQGPSATGAEDEKKIAMRRAIADKLKQEVIASEQELQ